jgi:hypothetical protein
VSHLPGPVRLTVQGGSGVPIALPPLIFAFVAANRITAGLTAVAVKG